jgi:AcrR family transcriptional regulator
MAVRKDSYHHGDLRRALMDEALRLMAGRGLGEWSLREVAAALGVSHAAPYHHFRDRADLLSGLAREGLDLLDRRMARLQEAAGDDPKERLLAIGLAYVAFAVERPAYYAAIGAGAASPGPAVRGGPSPEPSATWRRLLEAVTACQRAGHLPAGDPVVIAVSLWSLVHGLAELWKAGPLRLLPHAANGLGPLAEQVLRASVDSLHSTVLDERTSVWPPSSSTPRRHRATPPRGRPTRSRPR